MFAYLIGTVAEVSQESLVLEVNRIGYHILIPASAVSLLPPVGKRLKYTLIPASGRTLSRCSAFCERTIWRCTGS